MDVAAQCFLVSPFISLAGNEDVGEASFTMKHWYSVVLCKLVQPGSAKFSTFYTGGPLLSLLKLFGWE